MFYKELYPVTNMNHFYLYIEKQKKIWKQEFQHDSSGFLGIIEIPHAFVYDTITSTDSIDSFIEEIKKYPYHYAWRVNQLKKVNAFVHSILTYIDDLEAYDLEEQIFPLMISEIQPYLIEEIDPHH
jgi:hypothetical protein